VYTPTANYYGTDTLTYTVADSHGGTATSTSTITIAPVHDQLVAHNMGTYEMKGGESFVLDVSTAFANVDNHALTYLLSANATDMSSGWLCADYFDEGFSASFPYWMWIDWQKGVVHVNPEATESNIVDITVKAKDHTGYVSTYLQLTINGTFEGTGGEDVLLGKDANDTLKGFTGDDVLEGGLGADILFGGAGNDVFDFNNLADSTESSMDTIMGFEHGRDKIDLQDLGFHLADFTSSLTFEVVDGVTIMHDSHSDFAVKINGDHVTATDFMWSA
jgi:Ca2+-binding RTX toxin-like protein